MFIYRVFHKITGDMLLKGHIDQQPNSMEIKSFVSKLYNIPWQKIELIVTLED